MAALRQPSAEEQQMLDRISAVLQQQLGVGLPDRALRGERSVLIASLAPEAVKERLGAWVGCCGRDYVIQLMTKEPTLLGHEPKVLLNTLQAVSSLMQLSPQVGGGHPNCGLGRAVTCCDAQAFAQHVVAELLISASCRQQQLPRAPVHRGYKHVPTSVCDVLLYCRGVLR